MSYWTEITEELCTARATTIEIERNDGAGAGEESPLAQNIRNAVAAVRAAIAQGRKTRLDKTSAKTVPASLVDTTLSIVIFNYASRILSQPIVVQDARYQQYSRAMEDLERLRKGDLIPEDPETGDIGDASAGVSVVSRRKERFSREAFRAL